MSIRQKTNTSLAILFMVLGGFFTLLCLPMVFAQDAFARLMGIGLLLSGLLMVVGGYRTMRAAKLEKRIELAENQRINQILKEKSRADFVEENSKEIVPEIYATWHFDAALWKSISNKTIKKSLQEEIYTAVWFPVLVPFVSIPINIWAGVFIGFALGVVYLIFKRWYIKQYFNEIQPNQTAQILLTDHYVRINGKYIHFANGHYWLKSASIDEGFLNLQIAWTTSKGYRTFMDIFLPIPADGTADATRFIEAYKQAININ